MPPGPNHPAASRRPGVPTRYRAAMSSGTPSGRPSRTSTRERTKPRRQAKVLTMDGARRIAINIPPARHRPQHTDEDGAAIFLCKMASRALCRNGRPRRIGLDRHATGSRSRTQTARRWCDIGRSVGNAAAAGELRLESNRERAV
jgi:hypothetical protein